MNRVVSFFCITFIAIFFLATSSEAAARFSAPRTSAPKQGYTRQAGGNAKQNTTVQYDRGNKHYTQTVKPGQTFHTPKDAQNVMRNGRPVSPSSRATTTPQGAVIFGD